MGVTRTKKYAELSVAEKLQVYCDMKATNIILQGLPADIYSLMKMEQFQVNTKFLNSLLLEWSKFVTNVKLVKDLHTSNFDQLHAYLEQHELHANEVCIMRERNQDPLAFVANQQMTPPHFNPYQSSYNKPQLQQQFSPSQYGSIQHNQHYSSTYPSQPQFNHLSIPPSHTYQSQINHQTSSVPQAIPQVVYQSPPAPTQLMTESPFVDSGFSVPVFSPGDDPIACLNKAMAFLTAVASSRVIVQQVQRRQGQNYSGTTYKGNAKRSRVNTTSGQARVVKCYNCQDPGIPACQAQTIIPHNAAFQTEDLDTYDFNCDDLSTAQAVLMDNISNYGSDIISEVPNSETYLNDMDNQSVHALQDFEQSPVMDFTNNEISSDSNIIPYSQYLQETQHATIQDTNLQAQQDLMILSVIEQISREKMIDSQMDDMIRVKLALKEQFDSLEQNLSKQFKEKESVLQTFIVFKNKSKEKENKYMENETDLEKKIKELDNIICKVGQSAQKRIKPTLYDGVVMSNTHVDMPVIDDEETLILEEESRSKMSEKAKDSKVIAKKISHKPIDFEKLNRLAEDFGKRFSPQQELLAKQAFWFHILNPSIESSYTPPVIVDVPSELPKVSLVNVSLKKLKFHLTQFDSVVKKRTTPNALEEGEWGFEHTKTIFNNEIIPFLKSLKDIFKVFNKDLLNEITEVQTVFDQVDVAVQQSLVDKQCLEIAKNEILLENDRFLQKIMSQDVMFTVMNSMSLNNDSVNMEMQKCESCEKCLNLDVELSKSKQAYNDLLKNYSQLEKHSQLQDKDKTICKLKDTIKSLRDNTKEENVNHECDLEPINKELENSVAKLLCENEPQIQDKVFVITSLKNDLRKIKGKEIVKNVVHIPSATTIAPGMFKLDLVLLPPRLLQNRDAHIDYRRQTPKQANTLREIVEQAKAKQPLDRELDFACKYTTRI
ncbi:hypothetical protein Tco_1019602 [Tanacetum coccineum]|uniref:Integrase, catalytic region, zinc finger, CCHC-type, peptidase aspartic, catalytic n=1 Tax=Tanacetum coccineum TaxID=301880 RepID=A0ABQ5FZY5_9ASTR